jgi:hypothetical protein
MFKNLLLLKGTKTNSVLVKTILLIGLKIRRNGEGEILLPQIILPQQINCPY